MKTVNILTALLLMAGIWGGSASAEFQGAQNTFYGVNAGINTAGDDDVNTFIGADAGFTNTDGAFNTFLGADVGYANSTGSHNTFVGTAAGASNSIGSNNSFFGSSSGFLNTGSNNTFLGSQAGWNNQTGNYNNFLGSYAGYNNMTGSDNTFLGYQAGLSNTTGNYNTFFGNYAGYRNTAGHSNTFLGLVAGYSNTTGLYNTFVGQGSGAYNTTGVFNVFLGNEVGFSNTTGSYNTFLGNYAGRNTTGNSNIFLGYQAGYNETGSNKLYIANSDTTSPLIYGNFAINKLKINGNVDITGSLSKGSGTFVQPHPADPSKEVAYAFFEGPEHAIFLRGKAKLVKGRATIKTPEYFRVVAGKDEDITVQFTPRSIDTFGVAAVQVTKDTIEVRELKGGKHSYEFDYFITAKRGGFEDHQPIQPNTHFTANEKTVADFEQTYAKTEDLTINAMRQLLIANGILTKGGKLNQTTAAKLGWHVQPVRVATTKP